MRIALLTSLSVAVLALTGCLNDGVMQPAAGPAGEPSDPTTTSSDVWQAAIDELTTLEGGEALLAELTPLIDKARATPLGPTLRDGGHTRFFLAFERTEFVVVPPFPPPVLTLEITFDGWSNHGRYTGFSLSSVDVTVIPNVQTGTQTDTYRNGDELVTDYAGIAVPGAGEGDVEFEGSSAVVGGTGRFAGATGTIHYVGSANQIEAMGQVLRWGYITTTGDDGAGPPAIAAIDE